MGGGGEPDSKQAGESAKMAEEDSPPVAESVADAETVQEVKKDEKDEIDGEQIDSDVGEGGPDSKKAGESAKMAEEDSPPVAESVAEVHEDNEQETKGEGIDSKQEEKGDDDGDDDRHDEEVKPEVGTEANEVAKKPDSTVEADPEAAQGTKTEPKKQAGDEAKEAEVAEAMTSDAVELAGWQRVLLGQQGSQVSLLAGVGLLSVSMVALALSAFRCRYQSASHSQTWIPRAESDLLELAEADLLRE